jgi:hypothetical protein
MVGLLVEGQHAQLHIVGRGYIERIAPVVFVLETSEAAKHSLNGLSVYDGVAQLSSAEVGDCFEDLLDNTLCRQLGQIRWQPS